MTGRVWDGWTAYENSDSYHNLLNEVIFPEIVGKNTPGYKEIQLSRGPALITRSSASASRGSTPEVLLDNLLGKIWSRHMVPGKPGRCFPELMPAPATTES